MAEYVERSQERAYASSQAWANFKHLAFDAAKIASIVTVGIGVMSVDQVRASDQVTARSYYIAQSNARITDEATAQRHSLARSVDRIRIRDQVRSGRGAQSDDQITISDSTRHGIRARVNDAFKVSDQSSPQRSTLARSVDRIRIRDQSYARFGVQLVDEIKIQDEAKARLHVRVRSHDTIKISDQTLFKSSVLARSHDRIKIQDEVKVQLHITARSHDVMYIADQYPQQHIHAQAWVTSQHRFAMSRYAPFNFEGLTVINGKLYAWNDQGVFLLGPEGEQIEAQLTTGKLDFGDQLVHPTMALMEYQLSGDDRLLEVGVTTTQSGQAQQYSYSMTKERSDELTNGRVQFGRGLRGRHFAFEFKVRGTSAEINAVSLDYTPTARRI